MLLMGAPLSGVRSLEAIWGSGTAGIAGGLFDLSIWGF